MAKLTYRPIDNRPVASAGAMALRIFGLIVVTLALLGMVYLMLQFSYEDEKAPWGFEHSRIRTNFHPLYTSEEINERMKQKQQAWEDEHGVIMPDPGDLEDVPRRPAETEPALPFGRDEEQPEPERPFSGTRQSVEAQRDEAVDLEIAKRQLTKPRVFVPADESQHFVDWVPLRDADREQTANEFAANNGRQADVYERLALQVLNKLPSPDYAERVHHGAYFWGKGQGAADTYRGYGFAVEGRLFDLFEQTPDAPVILRDGTSFERWYVGAVALLDQGVARNEFPIEHRVVLFMAPALPAELLPFVGDADGVSHEDRLASEHVMVSLTGAYLRRWMYSREVKPYSDPARKVVTQAHAPLLLSVDVALSSRERYALTDEMLQQVRDSMREAPRFLETEGAYYAILAQANEPDDHIEPVPEISYFDLAGRETGPRYRGEGVRIDGMIGQNYEPVILPPNISGVRRVFRAFVVDDRVDMASEKRYLLDMIDPPSGLEPLAMVRFNARYYRNVYEMADARSHVRPLLIVKRAAPYARDDSGNWVFALFGILGVVGLLVVLSLFVLSDRRERKAFEQNQIDLARKRLEKRGGLKLKPLPKKESPEG